jgi:hypothetical protein
LDRNIPWETFKFDICVTWPLDIQMHDPDKKGSRWHILLFNQIHEPFWRDCPCLQPENHLEKKHACPPIIISQKTSIISHIGTERYAQLVEFAKTYKPS